MQGIVSRTNDSNHFSTVKKCVTDCTKTNTTPLERTNPGHRNYFTLRTCRKNDRIPFITLSHPLNTKPTLSVCHVNCHCFVLLEANTDSCCSLNAASFEFRPRNWLGKAVKVFNQRCASKCASPLRDDCHIGTAAPRIECGGDTGRPRTNDDDVHNVLLQKI